MDALHQRRIVIVEVVMPMVVVVHALHIRLRECAIHIAHHQLINTLEQVHLVL